MANINVFRGDIESLTEFPPLLATHSSANSLDKDTESTSPEAVDAPATWKSLAKRVYLGAEAGGDYTDGPARLVVATDAKKECTALLITEDLSNWVQTAVLAKRSYTEFEPKILAQCEALDKVIERIDDDTEEEKTEWFHQDCYETEDGALEKCEERLRQLEERRDEAFDRRCSLLESREQSEQKWLQAQAEVMSRLEKAFVLADLLPRQSGAWR